MTRNPTNRSTHIQSPDKAHSQSVQPVADARLERSGLPSVSVCFPAYNEEATIEDVLLEAGELLSGSGLDFEILVCDDASKDSTLNIARRVQQQFPMRVFVHERNMGIRATFEHLYANATKEFVFLNSTDRQWDTSVLFQMLPMTAQFDVIIASRLDKNYGPARGLVSWAFNAIPRVLFGTRTYDAGAVKLVKREIIQRCEIVSKSPFSEAERLIRAARAGYRIAEHPVVTRPRESGKAKGVNAGVVFRALVDVVLVWFSLRKWKLRGDS